MMPLKNERLHALTLIFEFLVTKVGVAHVRRLVRALEYFIREVVLLQLHERSFKVGEAQGLVGRVSFFYR